MFGWLFYDCQKTGIEDLHGNHSLSRRFREESYFVCMSARGQATQGEPAPRGDTWRWHTGARGGLYPEGCVCVNLSFHTDARGGPYPAAEPGGASGGALSAQPPGGAERYQGVRAAPRGDGDSRADAAAGGGRRRPVTRSAHPGGQRSSGDSPGSCRFKGRGRSREAARSFWLPEPAPSAAARPRPLPEGAHGSGRLSADCRKFVPLRRLRGKSAGGAPREPALLEPGTERDPAGKTCERCPWPRSAAPPERRWNAPGLQCPKSSAKSL